MDSDEYEYLEKTGDIPEPEKFEDPVNGSEKIDKPENKDPSRRPKEKSNRHNEDFDHQVKCSWKGDESHYCDNDRNSSVRNRSSSTERERNEREKHRRRRESKNRDMDRDRENSSRKERDGDKIREINRERYRDRDKRDRDSVYEGETKREREQERSNRNRNNSERSRDEWDRERSREKGRSHDMEYKKRKRVREVSENVPESRGTKEKKEEVTEPEADPERDQRTVFAYQISLKADERDVYEFFSRAGKVRDVHLILDRNSRRTKGVGYIEFYDVMSVPVAIALSGQLLLGQPVMVKPSEAEKNLVQSTAVAPGASGLIGPYSGESRQLYVGNLHPNIQEDQLHQVFEPFGTIELVQLPSDPETGRSKGYGFVQFARLADARAAQSLDGQLEIAGQVMKVSAATDLAGGREASANAGDFADDGVGGLALNAQSRTLLMQKLGCKATSTSIAGSLGAAPAISTPAASVGQTPSPALAGLPTASFSIPAAVPSIDTIGVPSACLLLKNMFDPKVESEPDFDQDIKDDVGDECARFGDLKHIYVDKHSAGCVYLRFQNNQSAIAAQRALHGRWFAGKMISATFVVPQNYEAKFPESK